MAAVQFTILLDHSRTPFKVKGSIDAELFPNFDFQRGTALILKEVAFDLGHYCFDFQSYSRRKHFFSHLFDFQRLYRYTISPMEYEGPVWRRKNTIGLSSDLRNRAGQIIVTPNLINAFIHPAEGKKQLQVIAYYSIDYLLSDLLHKKPVIAVTGEII